MTTYRGLKYHKAEQFNSKLIFENVSQNIHQIYKKLLVVNMRIFAIFIYVVSSQVQRILNIE